MFDWLCSPKDQCIHSICACIDYDHLSCCQTLAEFIKWCWLEKWCWFEKILELGELPDPFHQLFPFTNQPMIFLCNILSIMLVITNSIFNNKDRAGKFRCIKLLTNFLKPLGQFWFLL